MMTLYSGTVDPFSQRCRIVLFEKGMDFQIIDVDVLNKPEDLAVMNPYNKVPVLVERDLILHEANIINEYIDERFPHPQLMPADPVMRGRTRLFLHRFEQELFSHIDAIENGTAKAAEKARTVVRDNLWDLDVAQSSSGDGRAFQFVNGGGGGLDIKIDHNTTTANKNSALTVGDTAKYGKNFVFTNNLVPHGDYGVFGSEGAAKASLDFFLISYVLDHNAIFGGGDAGDYPAGNFFPASTADVGFAADWSLKPSSKYKSAGSDGKDLGADIAGLIAATKGVVQ